MTVDMQRIIDLEEEVEGRERVKEWRENAVRMAAETEARGRQGAKVEILSDCPNEGKEREAIAAIEERKEGEESVAVVVVVEKKMG